MRDAKITAMGSVKGLQAMDIRGAIKIALKRAFIAKETGNREAYLDLTDWIRKNWRERNTGKQIFWKA